MPFVPDQPTRGRFVPDAPEEPISVQAGRGLMEIPRQVGLAARYGMEGPAQFADIFTEPLRNLVINPIARALGSQGIQGSTSNAVSKFADTIGLPNPEGANERVVGDASRFLSGSAVPLGLASKAAPAANSVAQRVTQMMTQAPGQQAVSAAGAGLAGGSVREAGGGPGAQFGASLMGGLVAPMGASAVAQPLQWAESAARRFFAPQNIEATLKAEFTRAGMDWDALGRQAQMAIAQDAEKAIYSGQPLNIDALRRLADFRNVPGAVPTMGAITQNPALVTQERNLAKQMANMAEPVDGPSLPMLENQNTRASIKALQNQADSPMDTYATGQALVNRVQGVDAAKKGAENALYGEARDTGGRAIPLDRAGFVDEAFNNLQNSNRGGWLPGQIKELLNDISVGKAPFTVDTIDMLKTLLAQESRATANGNVRQAIADVRNALENVQPAPTHQATGSMSPIPGQMGARLAQRDAAASSVSQESLDAFNRARAFARSRREWQESAPFIEDALNGAAPDQFVDKHILRGTVENLGKLKDFISNDPELRNAVRSQIIAYITRRGSVDDDIVKIGSSKAMKDALDFIGDRKLALFFDPKEIGQIKSAVNVARYIQAQPAGSAVNNSNTAAMTFGKLSDLLLKGSKLPLVGPLGFKPLHEVTLNMQGRQVMRPADALMIARQRPKTPITPLLLAAGIPSSNQ